MNRRRILDRGSNSDWPAVLVLSAARILSRSASSVRLAVLVLGAVLKALESHDCA